jgi:hypothetical protein
MRETEKIAELARIFLSEPMSSIRDEYTALKQDHHLNPDLLSVTMLRLVRRALMGDAELAMLLMVLGGSRDEVERAVEEESLIVKAMREDLNSKGGRNH